MQVLEPAPGAENVKRVAAGGADYCLTSVTHYLTARAQISELPARFISVVVQRSPMAGIVSADSSLNAASDLAGRRLGGPAGSRLVAEYQAALAHLGVGPSVLVPVDYDAAPGALGRGDIEVVADFVDLTPRVRLQAGIPVRAIPVGRDHYASGLVAADRLPAASVARMRAAVGAALDRQRQHPEAGLLELQRRYPSVDPSAALEGWALAERNIFTGVPPGSMEPERWTATIDHVSRVHDLPAPPPHTVYRPELVRAR